MKKFIFLLGLGAVTPGCMAASNDNVAVADGGGAPGTGGVGAVGATPGIGGHPAGGSGAVGGIPGSGAAPGSGAVAGNAGAGGSAGQGGTSATGGTSGLPSGCFLGSSAECNPTTNQGCTGGAACDIGIDANQAVHLVCYPPPNDVPLGGDCNAQSGPYCAPGSLCSGSPGTCIRFCCSSADCAGNEECAPADPTYGTIGGCLPSGAGGSDGTGGSGGVGGGGGTGGFDLTNCTGPASTSGSVAGVTPKPTLGLVQPDPSGNVKLILSPKVGTSNGDVVVGVYFFAQPGQMSYPPNGSVGCAILEYQNGWKVIEKSTLCEVSLSQLQFASQKDTCDGAMVGTFKGVFSGNAAFGGSFAVPLEIATSQIKAPSCQPMNGPCSAHTDCCSQSCSLFIGVCN